MNGPLQAMGRAERRIWLLSRMMARLGTAVASISEPRFRAPLQEARATCLACRHGDECEAWLSRWNVAYSADAPKFCPNAELFRRMRAPMSG